MKKDLARANATKKVLLGLVEQHKKDHEKISYKEISTGLIKAGFKISPNYVKNYLVRNHDMLLVFQKALSDYFKYRDDIICKEIKNCPQNLYESFRKSAIKLKTTPKIIKQVWYCDISKRDNMPNRLFLIHSNKKLFINRKVVLAKDLKKQEKVNKNIIKKIADFVKNLL